MAQPVAVGVPLCPYWKTGGVWAIEQGVVVEPCWNLPSHVGQPRFAPRSVLSPGNPPTCRPTLTSSHVLWPTSATIQSPLSRSNDARNGLRTPEVKFSGHGVPPGVVGLQRGLPAFGLSAGIPYGRPPA